MKEKINVKWKWRPKRWWIGLARSGISNEGEKGFIILLMLIFATVAAINDRAWKIYIRVIWVIGLWVIHAILSFPIAFIIGPLFIYADRLYLLDRAVVIIAAFPLIIWAMRRSKYFVTPITENTNISEKKNI
jgi:hypothetical protein